MNEILLKVQLFLDAANRGQVTISDELLDDFADDCRHALKRHFCDPQRETFTVRMSNIGRPLCQLQHEKAGTPAEQPEYAFTMKMLYGDLIEAASIAIMKAAGVNVVKTQEPVTLTIEDRSISGTYDLQIDDKVFDLKSASPYAFEHKFDELTSGGYHTLKLHDDFGYVAQGFGYGNAAGLKFGGWIVVNKVTGEWTVCEVPDDNYEREEGEALAKIKDTYDKINADAPIVRCFEDEEESYYRKKTGNRCLGKTCEFCAYKWTCWPGLKALPSLPSKGKNPRLVYYTYIDPDYMAAREAERTGGDKT